MGMRRREQDPDGRFQCPTGKGCGIWKFPEEFYQNKRTMDGISTYCKDCQKDKQKQYNNAAQVRKQKARDAAAKALLDKVHEENLMRKTFDLPPMTVEEYVQKYGDASA